MIIEKDYLFHPLLFFVYGNDSKYPPIKIIMKLEVSFRTSYCYPEYPEPSVKLVIELFCNDHFYNTRQLGTEKGITRRKC